MRMPESPARALWQCIEPYHAVTYFTDEARAAFEDIGLRGFWRGYFAGRAAPLGAVGPGAVVATFYGFHPDFVARAIPEVWSIVAARPTRSRRASWARAARSPRCFDMDEPAIARAARLVLQATDGCDPFARPLFAANHDLAWPREPHIALWHGCTLLREHRGDGHIATLYAADVDPCEAHVLRLAVTGVDRATHRAVPRLGRRRLGRGRRPPGRAGLARRAARRHAGRAPTRTPRSRPTPIAWRRARPGPSARTGSTELLAIMRPLAAALAASGTIPFPNPIGVPPSSVD